MQALYKYKQKRKNLNFTKKIRYESRKQLAQARPRVKGQFVRMASGAVDADAAEAAAEADAADMLGDMPNLAAAADAALAAVKVAAEEEGMDFQEEVRFSRLPLACMRITKCAWHTPEHCQE